MILLAFVIQWGLLGGATAAAAEGVVNRSPQQPSVAFYYAPDIPPELAVYDAVVVQPEALVGKNLARHPLAGKMFAYVSVGEVESQRPYFKSIPHDWLVGENKSWKSALVNQAAMGWPEFYVREVIAPLWRQGFRGFFLDTLDSYQLIAKDDTTRHKQEEGLITLIRAIKKTYPEAKLIFNRGFEILPQVHDLAYAVAAESLFQGWDNGKQKFVAIKTEDRQWLLEQLNRIRTDYGLPVIVIDYAPASDRKKMRALADQITALGFIPWVTTPAVDVLGIGVHEIIPRRVLMLYDMRDSSGNILTSANRFLSMPLNYLGLIPVLHDAAEPLPTTPLAGRYAGIVLWFGSGNDTHGDAIHEWLAKQRQSGVPIAVLNAPGMSMDGAHLDVLDLKPLPIPNSDTVVTIDSQNQHTGFEITPQLNIGAQLLVTNTRPSDVWLRLKAGDDLNSEPVAITDWGGYALAPHAAVQLPNGLGMRWMIDPFAFLTAALQLPPLPAPDVTTEKGKRLLITHIDGDGFANLAEFPGGHYAGEILRDQILRRYRVPTTVSVIQGEVAANGAYPKLSPKLEPIARSIFALPNVEIASHSFSHPFNWGALESGLHEEGFNLKIPNYDFNIDTEIDGSIRYIDEKLAPPGKKTKVFLWTGNCNPSAAALARTYQLGVGNMNGGDTMMTKTYDTITSVSPIGVYKGDDFQVFAPDQNENVYTNNWRGPYYGYERAIETFELTESPRRLKPINIYYHTYSASKPAALTALHKVYQYALKQNVLPIYASEYIRKAQNFNNIVITHEGDGWGIYGATDLVTLRIPASLGDVDMERSRGVLASVDHADVRYLHLSNSGSVHLAISGSGRGAELVTKKD